MVVIKNLQVSIEKKPILNGVDLAIEPGEIHAIMGPNGSGKSTLAYTLAGHPHYAVEKGSIKLGSKNVLKMSADQRARAGIFLAFQYPVEISGVSVQNFLKAAYEARFGKVKSVLKFRQDLVALADELGIKKELIQRNINEGFSGGEKKRVEILQMAVLQPKLAILDETDSGLDVDAIKSVAKGVRTVMKKFDTAVLVITHYQRILKYLQPDRVHVMVAGKIIKSGGKKFAEELETGGYKKYI
ncbi:MAG TPA: Fe-S cluster assembly ATPase SufC [Candidatus Saccharimonadia bacterium]|nr:Fe-S cluster assembly ATPase SufC [Candidatus Saccharimonadia bacterium]